MEHIPFRQLTDYAYNRSQDQQLCQQIKEHVSECAQCRQALAIGWQIAQAAVHAPPQPPAATLVERALKAARRQQQQQPLAQITPTLLQLAQQSSCKRWRTQEPKSANCSLPLAVLIFIYRSFTVMSSTATPCGDNC